MGCFVASHRQQDIGLIEALARNVVAGKHQMSPKRWSALVIPCNS